MSSTAEQRNFSTPMPWIGLYTATASAACSIAMFLDVCLGQGPGIPWFRCNLFPLSAASLTLLAISTKLCVDLTTPMPGAREQFSKLCGTVFICISMAHFMPSLGAMEASQLISNIVPLAILVITVFVNMCIQMGTGVIHAFIPEHIITLIFMLIMLLITCSSALAVPTMKRLLKQKYELKYRLVSQICKLKHGPALRDWPDDEAVKSMLQTLKGNAIIYWVMALSCDLQHVLYRSSLSWILGVICTFELYLLVIASSNMKAQVSVPLYKNQYSSDYKWSIALIILSQATALEMGIVAVLYRKCLQDYMDSGSRVEESDTSTGFKKFTEVEGFWIQIFEEWKESHLPFDTGSRLCQRLIHRSKNFILEITRLIHVVVVASCKAMAPPTKARRRRNECAFLKFIRWILEVQVKIVLHGFNPYDAEDSALIKILDVPITRRALASFVVHLEGEDGTVDMVSLNSVVFAARWYRRGRKKPLVHLKNVLKISTDSQSFNPMVGNCNFVSAELNKSLSLSCLALPMVTLTSIAVAIPSAKRARIKSLLDGVNEGLKYVRIIDKKLDSKGPANILQAADIVWQGVNLYRQWLKVDLAALAHKEEEPKKIIEALAEEGRNYTVEFTSMASGQGNMRSGLEWSPKALAGYSMNRLCEIILSNFSKDDTNRLFEWLEVLISDMLVACVINLPRTLFLDWHSGSIEPKAEDVWKMACLLGEVENLVKALEREGVLSQCKYAGQWHSFLLNMSTLTDPISIGSVRSVDEVILKALEREGVLDQCKYDSHRYSSLLNMPTIPDPISSGNVRSVDEVTVSIE